jgi:bifunctional non-homologous end joining protein LigD
LDPKTTTQDAPFLKYIEPCLPTLKELIPGGPEWLHEIKYDGYRTQVHLREGAATLYTRRGFDWTQRFGTLTRALTGFPARTAILDGEVVVPDAEGIPDFEALYADLAGNRTERLLYYVFDLLYLDGQDLRRTPLIERKRLLWERTSTGIMERLRYSEHLEGNAEAMFEHACRMRLEGIVSKKRDSRYSSGRSESWLKTKCVKRDSFPIIAFVEKLGAKPRRIASLHIGRWEGGRLLYAGKAKPGTPKRLRAISARGLIRL